MEKKVVRIALVLLAVFAIGILVLPSTMTLFAGQHTWYYKEALPCEKCHADVADEFQSPANYHPPGNTYPTWEACVLCHQVEPLYPGDVSAEESKHAATVVPCDYCHNPEANAFDNDPHLPFVQNASESDQMPNATEACVACHTHARGEINFTWNQYMTFGFSADATANRNETAWTDGEAANLWNPVEQFNANGSESHIVYDYGAHYDNYSGVNYSNVMPAR